MVWVAAVAQVQSLAQELPHAAGVAKKTQNNLGLETDSQVWIPDHPLSCGASIYGLAWWVKDLALPCAVV